MHPWTFGRFLRLILISAVAWAIVACASLMVGSTAIGWPTKDQWPYRLEYVLTASLVGAALGGAGSVYQAILQNPLADPYLLGISSGASLAAYLWQFSSVTLLLGAAVSQELCAFAGAIVAVVIVLLLGNRRGRLDPVTLLLVGVIVSTFCAAIFLLVNALHPELIAGSGGPMNFLVGGIRYLDATHRLVSAAVMMIAWIVLVMMSGSLNLAVLSENEAMSLGVRIHRLRWTALILASLLTAAAVAISGPIAFVGLICPHICRLLVGHDQRRLLPTATACGAMLLCAADAVTRLLSQQSLANTVLPVGVLTALMGGPFFLWLLVKGKRQ